jgi:hypothetical protein
MVAVLTGTLGAGAVFDTDGLGVEVDMSFLLYLDDVQPGRSTGLEMYLQLIVPVPRIPA